MRVFKRRDGVIPIEKTRTSLRRSKSHVPVMDIGARSLSKSRRLSSLVATGISSGKKSLILNGIIELYGLRVLVELGTSVGINSLYLSLHPSTYLYTFEGNEYLVDVSQSTFSAHGKTNIELIYGDIDMTLQNKLAKIGHVDFAFIDANHTYEATVRYFECLLSHAQDHTVLVFDDIHWSSEMSKAWNFIIAHPKVTVSFDLFELGVIFLDPTLAKRNYVV